MTTMAQPRTRLRELNDACRTGHDPTARMTVTATCLAAISPADNPLGRALGMSILQSALRGFTFPPGDRSDRDMGWLTIGDTRVMWKIDYYDAALKWGSEDPTDPARTTRVLTAMLLQDY